MYVNLKEALYNILTFQKKPPLQQSIFARPSSLLVFLVLFFVPFLDVYVLEAESPKSHFVAIMDGQLLKIIA
jgi:hypothetical protein